MKFAFVHFTYSFVKDEDSMTVETQVSTAALSRDIAS